jgi:hypothetical protein
MYQSQHHRRDTVLLSGWLFADLLLGLMVIFLMAVPGIPASIAAPVLTVTPTSLDPTSSQCIGRIGNPTCTITISETASSQGDMTWTANSDMSDSVTFNPTNGTLSPGMSAKVTITSIPCQNGSFTFSGSRGARPVGILWRCTPPPEQLDFTFREFNLTINDINGLLNNAQNTVDDIKQQVRSQSFLNGRSVALAIAYGGAPTQDDISAARTVAQKVYDILTILGQEDGPNSPFHRASKYVPLYNLTYPANSVVVDVYLFKQ